MTVMRELYTKHGESFMRHGRQICEGQDFTTAKACVSEAHWQVKIFLDNRGKKIVTLYLCSSCFQSADADLAARRVPHKNTHYADGIETQANHDQSRQRYRQIFSAPKPQQQSLFGMEKSC